MCKCGPRRTLCGSRKNVTSNTHPNFSALLHLFSVDIPKKRSTPGKLNTVKVDLKKRSSFLTLCRFEFNFTKLGILFKISAFLKSILKKGFPLKNLRQRPAELSSTLKFTRLQKFCKLLCYSIYLLLSIGAVENLPFALDLKKRNDFMIMTPRTPNLVCSW